MCTALPSHADPTEADNANARSLFLEANAQREKGNIDQALQLYLKAHALKTSPIPGLQAGILLEQKGDLVGALEILRDVVRMSPFKETANTIQARKEANNLVTTIEPRVAKLVLTIKSKSEAIAIKLDGADFNRAMLDVAWHLNPGKHTLVLLANDQDIATKTFTLTDGSTNYLTFEVEGTLSLKATPGAQCDLGGKSIGATPLTVDHLVVGAYAITCHAANYKDKTERFKIEATKTSQVDLTLEPLAPPPATAATVSTEPAPATSPPAPTAKSTSSDGSVQRALGFVIGGIGIVGVGVGTVFGFGAMGKANDANANCPTNTTCTNQSGVIERHDAIAMGNVSTAMIVVGGIGLVAGGVLLLTAPSSHESSVKSASVRWVGNGVVIGGQF
jgi:hypothetical protein